ncbi:hypothetical protein DFH09DRAFT_1285487, partial [Mycena vulgaris]
MPVVEVARGSHECEWNAWLSPFPQIVDTYLCVGDELIIYDLASGEDNTLGAASLPVFVSSIVRFDIAWCFARVSAISEWFPRLTEPMVIYLKAVANYSECTRVDKSKPKGLDRAELTIFLYKIAILLAVVLWGWNVTLRHMKLPYHTLDIKHDGTNVGPFESKQHSPGDSHEPTATASIGTASSFAQLPAPQIRTASLIRHVM